MSNLGGAVMTTNDASYAVVGAYTNTGNFYCGRHGRRRSHIPSLAVPVRVV